MLIFSQVIHITPPRVPLASGVVRSHPHDAAPDRLDARPRTKGPRACPQGRSGGGHIIHQNNNATPPDPSHGRPAKANRPPDIGLPFAERHRPLAPPVLPNKKLANAHPEFVPHPSGEGESVVDFSFEASPEGGRDRSHDKARGSACTVEHARLPKCLPELFPDLLTQEVAPPEFDALDPIVQGWGVQPQSDYPLPLRACARTRGTPKLCALAVADRGPAPIAVLLGSVRTPPGLRHTHRERRFDESEPVPLHRAEELPTSLEQGLHAALRYRCRIGGIGPGSKGCQDLPLVGERTRGPDELLGLFQDHIP